MTQYEERLDAMVEALKSMRGGFEDGSEERSVLEGAIFDVELVGPQYAIAKLQRVSAYLEIGLSRDPQNGLMAADEPTMEKLLPVWGCLRLLEQVQWEMFFNPTPATESSPSEPVKPNEKERSDHGDRVAPKDCKEHVWRLATNDPTGGQVCIHCGQECPF